MSDRTGEQDPPLSERKTVIGQERAVNAAVTCDPNHYRKMRSKRFQPSRSTKAGERSIDKSSKFGCSLTIGRVEQMHLSARCFVIS